MVKFKKDMLSVIINTSKAAGMSRRHVQNKFGKNIKILELWDYIWNHCWKYIQTSTNMPGIGWESCEIALIWSF